MHIVLDLILLALIAGTVIYYWKRGFVKSVLGFGRTLLSFVIAWLLGPKLGSVISQKIIGNKITQKVYNMLASLYETAEETFDLSKLFENTPEAFSKVVERFGGDMAALEAKYGEMTAATRDQLVDLAQSIAAPITTFISNFFGFLIVFVVVFVLILLFSGVLAKIFELPVLKQVNHFLGLILGTVFAAMNALLFCAIGPYLLRFIGTVTGKFVADQIISETFLFRIISNIKLF